MTTQLALYRDAPPLSERRPRVVHGGDLWCWAWDLSGQAQEAWELEGHAGAVKVYASLERWCHQAIAILEEAPGSPRTGALTAIRGNVALVRVATREDAHLLVSQLPEPERYYPPPFQWAGQVDPLDVAMEGRRREVYRRWLTDVWQCGLRAGLDLVLAMPMGLLSGPADVDPGLRELERRGWVRRIARPGRRLTRAEKDWDDRANAYGAGALYGWTWEPCRDSAELRAFIGVPDAVA